MRREPRTDVGADCDSEGNDPPLGGEYVDPNTIDDSGYYGPPRTNERLVLPFYKPKEPRRAREAYQSRIGFEDWVQEDGDGRARAPSSHPGGAAAAPSAVGSSSHAAGKAVLQLEEDDDNPVGRLYFWHAYCSTCSTMYHPHIPGSWTCLKPKCREANRKVWQQPSDPESGNCAVCTKSVASIRTINGKRIRNPMTTNAHMCKRCGRVVCDACYAPKPVDLTELGYSQPQRVCTRCVKNIAAIHKPPEGPDLGTLYEERGSALDAAQCKRFWPPHCTACNKTFDTPPPQWKCTACGKHVWQPATAPESKSCWRCSNPNPKVRCDDCGQLACDECGAFAQPLPARGFLEMDARTVCAGCYRGVQRTKRYGACNGVPKPKPIRARCEKCKQPQTGVPPMWLSTCHKAKAWQTEGTVCAICAVPVLPKTGENCRRCGKLVCPMCAQFREPVPERGYAKTEPMTICKQCFDPNEVMAADPSDFPFWPPECRVCGLKYDKPPDRWRCVNQCGPTWQPVEHVASRCCARCGKAPSTGACNCRRCGRLVCKTCGAGRSEVTELGFTRGLLFATCTSCMPAATGAGAASPGKK